MPHPGPTRLPCLQAENSDDMVGEFFPIFIYIPKVLETRRMIESLKFLASKVKGVLKTAVQQHWICLAYMVTRWMDWGSSWFGKWMCPCTALSYRCRLPSFRHNKELSRTIRMVCEITEPQNQPMCFLFATAWVCRLWNLGFFTACFCWVTNRKVKSQAWLGQLGWTSRNRNIWGDLAEELWHRNFQFHLYYLADMNMVFKCQKKNW